MQISEPFLFNLSARGSCPAKLHFSFTETLGASHLVPVMASSVFEVNWGSDTGEQRQGSPPFVDIHCNNSNVSDVVLVSSPTIKFCKAAAKNTTKTSALQDNFRNTLKANFLRSCSRFRIDFALSEESGLVRSIRLLFPNPLRQDFLPLANQDLYPEQVNKFIEVYQAGVGQVNPRSSQFELNGQ